MSPLRAHIRSVCRPRAAGPWRIVAAVFTALGILAIGLGAVSPEAHEHVHADAAHPEHVCAITLASAGYCDTAAPAPTLVETRLAQRTALDEPTSHAWSAPDFWLIPAQAPPQPVTP